MEETNAVDSLPWKRPDEVMRIHRLKKRALLHARITRSDQGHISSIDDSKELDKLRSSSAEKRKNPFKCEPAKRFKGDSDLDVTSEGSFFQLLSERKPHGATGSFSENSLQSFIQDHDEGEFPLQHQQINIPVDWSLKKKIRLISPKPFPWSQKLRTCEEASGITGYVRCLDTGQSSTAGECESGRSLDTSPNARFHQCGLFWQHPSLPWLPLFPRMRGEGSSGEANAVLPPIALDPMVKECLHQEWCESFRSLFQLVRARQCPFFYLCANAFTCLFRAAGVAGMPEIHALLTPTTRGLRAAMKEEDVLFSMPLKRSPEGKGLHGRTSDEGYETLDSMLDDGGGGRSRKTSTSPHVEGKGASLQPAVAKDELDGEGICCEEDEEEEEASEWLEKMGVTEVEIKRMESEQAKHVIDRERDLDRKPESLVYVEGIEAQALFNFLMDCRSCVSPTGPLAGVPPTLLAPVAFRGATLGALKVRHSAVKVEGKLFHSVELRGPILPNAIHSLSSLLCSSSSSTPTFSATFAGIDSTRAFSLATRKPSSMDTSGHDTSAVSSTTASVFEKESLSDCGLVPSTLEAFCQASNSFTLDNLKFSDSVYSWSSS